MSAPDTVIINTLEAILASDLNRIGGLSGKSVQDALAMIEAGIVSSGNTPRSAVRKGLDASPGTGMAVVVSAGEVMRFDATVSPVDSSQYRLGRLLVDTSVALNVADATNPRVDVVYATITSTDEDSQIRNILTLPSRVVTPTAVFKSRRPTLSLAAQAGVPSATPTAASAPAGSIPLWYVYVPATVTAILSTYLADTRVRFQPAAISRSHGRLDGLFADISSLSLTSLQVGSGRAIVNGALLEVANNQVRTGVELSPDGATALNSATEYHLYALARGMGSSPVGAQVADGFVPVLTTTAPSSDGKPSAAILYRPLFGLGFNAWRVSTSDALYLGTFHTENTAQFQIGGDGVPQNADGTMRDVNSSLVVPGNGGGPTWLRKPTLAWASVNSVTVPLCLPVIGGIHGLYGGGTASLPADLISGVLEAANTWYYVYLRPRISPGTATRGAIRHYVLRISNVGPGAFGNLGSGPEAGFQTFDYLYVGCFFNDVGSNIPEFVFDGHAWLLKDPPAVAAFSPIFTGSPAITPARSNVQAIVPTTAKLAIVEIRQTTTVTAGPFNTDNSTNVFAEVGRASSHTLIPHTAGLSAGLAAAWHQITQRDLQIPLSSLKQFEVNRFTPANAGTPTIGFNVMQRGHVEDLLGQLAP